MIYFMLEKHLFTSCSISETESAQQSIYIIMSLFIEQFIHATHQQLGPAVCFSTGMGVTRSSELRVMLLGRV